MDPQKLAFLNALMNDAKGQNKDNLLPFLMAAASRAGNDGINFTDEETDQFYQQMKNNLRPEDQMRVEMLYQAIRRKR